MKCPNPIFLSEHKVSVPCQKCLACRQNRRQGWVFRLLVESESKFCKFVTFTFDDDHIISELDVMPLQKLFKRMRKTGLIFKYFAVAEFGSKTKRVHYHVLFFFDAACNLDFYKLWTLGFSSVGSVTPASISYVCKYVLSSENSKMICSRGLGLSYLTKSKVLYHKRTLSRLSRIGKRRFILPRYLYDKIFTKSFRLIKKMDLPESYSVVKPDYDNMVGQFIKLSKMKVKL